MYMYVYVCVREIYTHIIYIYIYIKNIYIILTPNFWMVVYMKSGSGVKVERKNKYNTLKNIYLIISAVKVNAQIHFNGTNFLTRD